MNEIDILVNAGLSRVTAELVVACHTMATTLGALAAQQQAGPPTPASVEPEGGDADGHDE